jgi:ribosomal protein S18 acetylase RimI-like enzyme
MPPRASAGPDLSLRSPFSHLHSRARRVKTITIEAAPGLEDTRTIVQELVKFNEQRVEPEGWEALAVLLRDEEGELRGGLNGYTHWGWLYIRHLWVDEDLRGQGFGRKLMRTAEEAAVARSCRAAHLDTHSFQSRGFYERLGYRVFGTLEDYPRGHQRFFMEKSLTAGGDGEIS